MQNETRDLNQEGGVVEKHGAVIGKLLEMIRGKATEATESLPERVLVRWLGTWFAVLLSSMRGGMLSFVIFTHPWQLAWTNHGRHTGTRRSAVYALVRVESSTTGRRAQQLRGV